MNTENIKALARKCGYSSADAAADDYNTSTEDELESKLEKEWSKHPDNTETKHTPGILRTKTIDGTYRTSLESENVCLATVYCTTEQGSAPIAERLAACWNACLAMADPENELTKLRADKAELLAALQQAFAALEKSVHFQSDMPFWRKGGNGHSAMLDTRSILAKHKTP